MEVTVDKSAACEAQVSFSVPSDEFEAAYKHALNHAAAGVRLKGFRPGKVPGHMLEKQFGERARQETIQHFLNQAYQQAVQENELTPAAHPKIDLEGMEFEKGDAFAHSFSLHLRPSFELEDYRGLQIEGGSLDVSEEEIDGAITDLRRQRATPEPAGEDGLPEDGMAPAKVTIMHDGEEVEAKSDLRVSPQTPMQGVDPEEFKKALTGGKEGDEIELAFTFPEGFVRPELSGKEGVAKIELGAPLRILLATDEDLWKLLAVEDAESFRDKVAVEIGKAKEEQDMARIETELIERLVEGHPMELSEGMVAEQAAARIESMKGELAEQGVGEEEIAAQLEGQDAAAREAAERGLRALFLIEAIAKEEDLQVQQPDVLAEMQSIAKRNNASFDDVKEYYQQEGLLNQMVMELQERKVRSFLREHAEVTRPE